MKLRRLLGEMEDVVRLLSGTEASGIGAKIEAQRTEALAELTEWEEAVKGVGSWGHINLDPVAWERLRKLMEE